MARKTRALNHVHKYYKFEETGLWYCALCSHYKPSNVPPPVWQPSRCWSCGKTFELNPDNMKNAHPLCDDCAAKMPAIEDADEKLERYLYEQRMKRFATPSDEIEVIEEHAPDCESYNGKDCTCK